MKRLWPDWLDRIYWRWYLKRHPYHLAPMTLDFMMRRSWKRVQEHLDEAFGDIVEEYAWVEDAK